MSTNLILFAFGLPTMLGIILVITSILSRKKDGSPLPENPKDKGYLAKFVESNKETGVSLIALIMLLVVINLLCCQFEWHWWSVIYAKKSAFWLANAAILLAVLSFWNSKKIAVRACAVIIFLVILAGVGSTVFSEVSVQNINRKVARDGVSELMELKAGSTVTMLPIRGYKLRIFPSFEGVKFRIYDDDKNLIRTKNARGDMVEEIDGEELGRVTSLESYNPCYISFSSPKEDKKWEVKTWLKEI